MLTIVIITTIATIVIERDTILTIVTMISIVIIRVTILTLVTIVTVVTIRITILVIVTIVTIVSFRGSFEGFVWSRPWAVPMRLSLTWMPRGAGPGAGVQALRI